MESQIPGLQGELLPSLVPNVPDWTFYSLARRKSRQLPEHFEASIRLHGLQGDGAQLTFSPPPLINYLSKIKFGRLLLLRALLMIHY